MSAEIWRWTFITASKIPESFSANVSLKRSATKPGLDVTAGPFCRWMKLSFRVAVDLSGRSYLHYQAPENLAPIGQFGFELVEEFLRAFSSNAHLNLHVDILRGRNSHHMAEGIFKGLAKALDQACQIDHPG